ncbi:MAG TPA: SLBB domain-containing protein [Gemmatimonadaceae bacterium]|nr:SLBB domain-containing protein [Gemmatimonadaceae bacterium]
MLSFLSRPLLAAALLCAIAAAPGFAQRPSPEQAREILRSRPDLVAQLRQRLASSGLTPDQIRARLRAEGYPENLLDPYLAGAGAGSDSLAAYGDVFAAVQELGLVDSLDVDMLRALAREPGDDSLLPRDTLRGPRGRRTLDDSVAADSLFGPRGRQAVDSGYAIFGLDVFRRSTSQFEPNLAGPVDPGYRLGPGDRLVLILTGDVELSYTLNVTREGFIVIPQVGRLDVANLTLAQLEDVLYTRLGRVYSGVHRGAGATTRFSVSVAGLRSNQVFVVGDVARPGSYRVSSAGTALSALYAASGPTENGSLRRIEIRRGGRMVDALDVYDYLLRGDASHDVRLETGDVVFVPVHGPRARVVGQVTRPATYELREGETLADVIRAAGGFTAEAARQRVQIERIVPPAERSAPGRDRVTIDIASEDLTRGFGPAVPIRAGDVVRVFPVAERVRNRIAVVGNVWAPGAQGFQPGMRLSDALRLAGGVKPDVYLGQVLITRLRPDSTREQLRTAFRDSTGAPVNDVELREDDEVQVFSLRTFRPTRYVAIAGAVRTPGRYPFRDGMTLRDLALLAGGLEESAYLREAEIARLPEDRSSGRTAQTFRVPLDSSYLFERTPDGRYLGPPGLPAPSAGTAPDAVLKPYDNVLILRQPDWEVQRTVQVGGEVRFPGAYALENKSERLSELLTRAGGLTPEAYPEGIYFYRKRRQLGRIGVDLPRVLRDGRHRDNLILQDGDSIYVPAYNAVVNVTGAVNSPVAVSFVPGKKLDYYIRAAGGPSRRADPGRAYVTQPNGKVESIERRPFFPDRVPEPRPGGAVFVPEKDPVERRDYLAVAGTIAQILASLVAVVAIAARR